MMTLISNHIALIRHFGATLVSITQIRIGLNTGLQGDTLNFEHIFYLGLLILEMAESAFCSKYISLSFSPRFGAGSNFGSPRLSYLR